MKVITTEDAGGTTQISVDEPRPSHEGRQELRSPKPQTPKAAS